MSDGLRIKRIAFFGGSFDPVHIGHIEIARTLTEQFSLDRFVYVPAFHAPHKLASEPASPFHRFAMLSLATKGLDDLYVSTIELENRESPYTIETMEKVKAEFPESEIFFVIGADSWMDITTWRRWEEVLTATNIIVVTRPGFEISFSHVTEEICARIADLRGGEEDLPDASVAPPPAIYITDSVNVDVSATALRKAVRDGEDGWAASVPGSVAGHIIKYGLYK